MTSPTPPSASADNEQENELSKDIYEYLRWQLVALRRNFRLTGMTDEYITAKARYLSNEINERIAHHTKETVARAKAEARKAAFDKIFEMAPKGNFEHWTKQMTANWFVALGRLERELSAPQQSKERSA